MPQAGVAPTYPTCQGKRRNGEPCHGSAITGRKYCRFHGGHAPRGVLNPSYGKGKKHPPGYYSKYIPTHLVAEYTKARNDPDRLSLQHEIAFWASQEQQFLTQIHADAGTAWPALNAAWAAMHTAIASMQSAQARNDIPQMRKAYDALIGSVGQGEQAIALATSYYGILDKIREAHDTLAKLRTLEHKRLQDLQQSWPSDRVLLMWGLFLDHLHASALRTLPKEHIRPFLTDFTEAIRPLEKEFSDMPQR